MCNLQTPLYSRIPDPNFDLILTSSTIDKKLEIYKNLEIELEIDKNLEIELEIYKNLENFEFYFEIFVNFEFYFEFFVISSFLSMVDELTINTIRYVILQPLQLSSVPYKKDKVRKWGPISGPI